MGWHLMQWLPELGRLNLPQQIGKCTEEHRQLVENFLKEKQNARCRPLNYLMFGGIDRKLYIYNNKGIKGCPCLSRGRTVTTTLSNALLSDILQQIRPLIGQEK